MATGLIGRGTLQRALTAVAARAGIPVGGELLKRLQGEGEEWQQLIEELVVPETWFFRDREPFIFLSAHLRRCPATAASRILSIPCSSGEEPYSIAITLLESGLRADRFAIQAADLSAHAIERARRGEYSKPSFREPTGLEMDRYFQAAPMGWKVRESLANLVEFRQANLLDLTELAGRGPYDAIFCRNVLIYMHEEARRKVVAGLAAMLAPGGIVITGHSEVVIFLQAGFERVDHIRAFAIQRPAQAAAAVPRPARATAPPAAPKAAPVVPTLEAARQLADQGDLEAAAEACEKLLQGGATDAEIYYLLGLISQVSDQLMRAEKLFEKALYLDPDHYQSLINMSLLAARQGDEERRQRFLRRAGKAAGEAADE